MSLAPPADDPTVMPPEPAIVPEPLQPVLSLLTQGLNVHATRLDALARAVTRLERGAAQQVEEADHARAEAEKRAAEAFARAEAAEQAADARLAASEARAAATNAALERRIAEMEARLEAVPPAFEELRSRSAQLELARGQHERELSARSAEIAEAREAHASLASRVDACATAAALASAEAQFHEAQGQQREELAESNSRQRRLAMQVNALEESHSQMHSLLSEQQQAVATLQKGQADGAAEAESQRVKLVELSGAHAELDAAQVQLNDTVQLGLARAVAAAEATRDDSERVSSAIAELEGWQRRLERLENDLSAAERRVDGAADEMRRQATHLENSQRNAMLQASQQVALHVKAMSGDLLRELQQKASIQDTQGLFDAMHKQFLSLREAHRALVVHVEAQGAAAETVADEAASAALQAQGALRGSEKVLEETQAWVKSQLDSVLGGAAPPPPMITMQQPQQSSMVAAAPAPPPGGGVLAQLQYRVDALEMRGRHMAAAVDDVSSPRGGVAHRLRDELYNDLKAELGKKLPSLDQVHSLQATLSAHVQRLPAVANYPHGRWTWNRGKLRASGGRSNPPLIPWSSEKLNTAPNALGWIADRAYIEVNASGMYAVLCAAFVPGAPAIGVVVNGQAVLRRVATGRQQVVDSSGQIAGSSLRDVILLAPGSKVAIQCEASPTAAGSPLHDAHGFLELKKLW